MIVIVIVIVIGIGIGISYIYLMYQSSLIVIDKTCPLLLFSHSHSPMILKTSVMSDYPSHATSTMTDTAVLWTSEYEATSEVRVRTLNWNLLNLLCSDVSPWYVALIVVYCRTISFDGWETPPRKRTTRTKPEWQSFWRETRLSPWHNWMLTLKRCRNHACWLSKRKWTWKRQLMPRRRSCDSS